MNPLQIDIEKVNYSVEDIRSVIKENSIETEYKKLINDFTDSKGKEADTLRSLLKTEKKLIQQVDITLDLFATSIQFAAKELQNLDKVGATGIKAGISDSSLTVRSKK